jgi:hypothetical protein
MFTTTKFITIYSLNKKFFSEVLSRRGFRSSVSSLKFNIHPKKGKKFESTNNVARLTLENCNYFLEIKDGLGPSERSPLGEIPSQFCKNTLRWHCYENGECVEYFKNEVTKGLNLPLNKLNDSYSD